MSASAMTAMQAGLQSCEGCGLLSRPAPGDEEGLCPRCDEELSFRKHASFQRTWAFLLAAAICYIPANVLPVLTTTTAGRRRVRYHHAGSSLALVADRMAAVDHRSRREHHDSEREDPRARLPAHHHAARFGREQ